MHILKKSLVLITAFCFLFTTTACSMLSSSDNKAANPLDPDSPEYEQVDPSLKSDEVSFFSKSGVTSCVVSGVLVGLTCLLLGYKEETCALAAVGSCAIVMGGNYFLDKIRSDYKNKEDQLDAIAKQLQGDNERIQKMIARSKEVLEKDKISLAELNGKIEKGEADQKTVQDKIKYYDSTIKYLTKQKEEAQKRLEAANTAKQGIYSDNNLTSSDKSKSVQDLEAKIKETEDSLDEMDSILSDFVRQRDSLQVSQGITGNNSKA